MDLPQLYIDLNGLMAMWTLHHPMERRLTITALSSALQVTGSILSNYRNHHRTNIEATILAKICWFFGCKPSALLRLPGEPPLMPHAVSSTAPSSSTPGQIRCRLAQILDVRAFSTRAGAMVCGIPYPTFRRWALDEAQSFHLEHVTKACFHLNVGVDDLFHYEPGAY